jgi:zinc D-Ala-D-Ala carboxypeptidase
MNFTENFSLEELIESQTARRNVITEQFLPSQAVIENLRKLSINLLQPLRDGIDKPIKISSGFRCKRLNKKIGGASNSEHVEGKAADIQAVGYTNKELFEYIKENMTFRQLIWEYGTKEEPAWVHVSWDKNDLKKQILYIGVK